MIDIVSLDKWKINTGKPFLIAGPCAAESEEQVLDIASQLKDSGIHLFRSGIWKPRTRPDSFEGVGIKGLPWLQRVKKELNIPVCVEVANTDHVDAALKYDIDVLWIGARTTVNPFLVQEIAESLRGVSIPVMIKNPVNAELELWIGSIERFLKIGINQLIAIHRGFSFYGETKYRNKPLWEIPIELRRRIPSLPILCDPSHICGKRDLISTVSQKALDLGFDGLMIETHNDPDNAFSDRAQQLLPIDYINLINSLKYRNTELTDPLSKKSLSQLRALIDKIDEQIISSIAERMELAEKIGEVKKENGITIYQPERWNEILTLINEYSIDKKLSPDLMLKLYEYIHKESIRKQSKVMYGTSDIIDNK